MQSQHAKEDNKPHISFPPDLYQATVLRAQIRVMFMWGNPGKYSLIP